MGTQATMPPRPGGRAAVSREAAIAAVSLAGIAAHLVLRLAPTGLGPTLANVPLAIALASGLPLVVDLAANLRRGEFSSDLLAGISILASIPLGEPLAGALVVLMLSGGQALEAMAVRRASFALEALARRMPSAAHRKDGDDVVDVALDAIAPGDVVLVFPHETCPVDGVVLAGRSTMNESYLTGEPFLLPKAAGAAVLSGSINGEGALTIRATTAAVDSRYAKIMNVMRESEQRRPRLRRLGDRLGAYYTPVAVAVAVAAWVVSGDPIRFLAVLVVATPCPLLIGIPVAVIGAVSLAARRGIVVRDPAALERIDGCRAAIFDKTGTLTHGRPRLTEILPAAGFDGNEVLAVAAGLERYSRHPLASAVLEAAASAGLAPADADEVSEPPGQGLRGTIAGRDVRLTGRKFVAALPADDANSPPPPSGGLECLVVIDGRYAATLRFRDEPRAEGRSFIRHLGPRHGVQRVLLVSGDRESEARHVAEQLGVTEIHAGKSPEEKLALVREETRRADTIFVGDGINDAPALTAATVGIAFGTGSDVAAEAAAAVVLDGSLGKVDELIHIGRRMRTIALQSAIGGMALSLIGMGFAAAGLLPPVAGALAQEAIDVLAVLNALRASRPPRVASDVEPTREG